MSDLSSGRSVHNTLADLHIFVVPLELWLDKYRTAFNNIALESVSAGFVRVHPETNLKDLRDCLEEQLGEDVIPDDFIFLRSVGRCMAVVKENQERLLKAADFLPPVAYSPEIFLLPGLHETYARPALDSKNVVVATQGHTTAGMSTTHPFHLPMIHQQYATNQHLTTQPDYVKQQDYHENNQQNKKYDSAYQTEQPGHDDDDDGNTNKQKQQRDSFDEEEIDSRHEVQDSKSSGHHSDGYHGDSENRGSGENRDLGLSPRNQKKDPVVKSKNKKNKQHRADLTVQKESVSPTEITTLQIIQPEVVHNMPVHGPDGYIMAPPTPIPSGRVIASPIPGPRKDNNKTSHSENKDGKTKKGSKKKRRSRSPSLERDSSRNTKNKEEKNKHEEPSQEYVVQTFEDIEERSRYTQFPSPTKSVRSHHPLYESEIDSGIADDLTITPPQVLNDSFGASKSKNELLDNRFVDNADSSTLNKHEEPQEHHQGIKGDAIGKDSETIGKDAKEGQMIAKDRDKDGTRGGGGIGKDGTKSCRKTKKIVKKPVKKTDDLDEKLKNLKSVEPPPLKIPDHGDVSLEKDTPSAKDRKHKVIEELRGQLRKAKNERVDLEKQRDQKVRRAKSLQTQTLQKRNQAKNIWKKKFFDEKRKTAPLEEQLNRLRYDVEVQHKAIVSYLETNRERDGNKGLQEQEKTPSDKTNQLMLLAKIQNEVEELKHKVEEIKMRLASEMKLRDNAQGELKQLREELMDKKINLTLTKSQKSLLLLSNQENITAQ